MYPDYYQIIKSPIALDDIKKRLDTDVYPSMHAVRADFELLFNNALQYNMKDSVIWKDAKEMLVHDLTFRAHVLSSQLFCSPQRLVHKTYDKLAPAAEGDDISDDDDKKGKSKAPNLSRLIKSRLQKLVEKTDKEYVRSDERHAFLETDLFSADASCPLNLWNCRTKNSGPSITSKSRNHNVSKISLCVGFASTCLLD